ncbi:MAG TPA: fumarylacetoacetate hydrolase family protein [Casimicrobiaceae bacterium]|nr:fumarylacetoacetate hydrolase family protein [Casimicrobiaceae bacterium]
MRLATFSSAGEARPRVGVLCGDRMLDVQQALRIAGDATHARFESMRELLALGAPALDAIRKVLAQAQEKRDRFATALLELGAIHFHPPIPDPEKFLCVGKNYRTHLEELKRTNLIREMPTEPTGFIKLNAALVGHDSEVERPASVTHLDYEPELVFVIGKPAYGVSAERAFDHVVGITLLNDLTCRDTQQREVASGTRFWTAKNAPGFGPVGPFVVTMDEVRDPYDLWLSCRVNGETRMRVNTHEQIWKLPDIVQHFSRLVPLAPGDMFSTGAPGGVAVGKPNAEELYLKPGDVVECVLDDPELVLRTRIVAAKA